MLKKASGGYAGMVSRQTIEEYRKWPMERRLRWLMAGIRLRRSLPEKTVALQDAFRKQGEC